jgi:alkylated DNA repair dioxygenase AlkB
MNYLLEANNYLYLPAFISKNRAASLADGLARHHQLYPLEPDTQVPGSPSLYGYLPFIRLLVEKIPDIEVACEEKILPTYAYARIYGHGDSLSAHVDRDACELSLSLNLDADQAWPIFLKKPNGESTAITLHPGDAVMYLGCVASHWRDMFQGTHCSQVFMHYVFSYGKRAEAYFDKKRKF